MVEQIERLSLTISLYGLVVLVILGFLIFLKQYSRNKTKIQSRRSILSFAKWEDAFGIIFGMSKFNRFAYSPANEESHVAVVGGTGSGKTSALLIPTLLSFKGGTYFAVDLSGDIAQALSNYIAFRPRYKYTVPYNVFSAVDCADEIDKNIMLEQLSFAIMPERVAISGDSLHFYKEGRRILQAALIAFYHKGLDFCEICRIVFSSSSVDLFTAIDQCGDTYASMLIEGFRGTSPLNVAACHDACNSAIKNFAINQDVIRSVRRPKVGEIAITPALLETKNILFCIPEYYLESFAPLLRLITAQSFNYFSSRPIGSHPILFAIDEFARLGYLDIANALRTLRKRGVRIMALTQALADIDLIYGRAEREVLMNNFAIKVVLSATDVVSQQYFAELLGHKYVKRVAKTTRRNEVSYTETLDRVWEIEPEDLGRLGRELIVIHSAGYDRLVKAHYFRPPICDTAKSSDAS